MTSGIDDAESESHIDNAVVPIQRICVLAREVAALMNEEKSAGTHTVQWDARGVASGVYFYRLKTDSYLQTKRMMLIK
jgi:hypothetical protein